MKKLLLTLLLKLLILSAFAQNTVTIENGTLSTTPQFRYKVLTPDSLNHIWINNPFTGKANRIYTSTEINAGIFTVPTLLLTDSSKHIPNTAWIYQYSAFNKKYLDTNYFIGPGDVLHPVKPKNTGVTAGSYTNANIQVDAVGRIISASNGSGGGTWGTITGTLSAQTDLQTALNARELLTNKTATASTSTTTYPNWLGVENYVTSGVNILNQNSSVQTGNFILKGAGLFKDNLTTGRLSVSIDSSKVLINQGGNILTLNNNVNFQNGVGQTGLETTTGASYTSAKHSGNITVYSIAYPNDTTGVSNTVIGGNNPVLFTNSVSDGVRFIVKKTAANSPSFLINDGSGMELTRITSDHNTNYFAGYKAGLSNTATSSTSGESITAIGSQAGYNNTTGYDNVFLGTNAGYFNIYGYRTIAIGSQALYNVYGYQNIAIGAYSLYSKPGSNFYNNIALGDYALYSDSLGFQNIAIGHQAAYGNTTGFQNIAIGEQALYSNSIGSGSVAIGYGALNRATGSNNTTLGFNSLGILTTGSQNTGFGRATGGGLTIGNANTLLGNNSGSSLVSGSNNIAIGAWVDFPSTSLNGQLNIGNVIYGLNLYQSISANSSIPTTTGSVGIGLTTPTARLHLPAGTATAATAPLKLTSGTNLTTPEDGAIEYNGTHYYATIGTTRFQLDQQSGGGGSGTVTSIATSTGIIGGTITTSGTLKADTTILQTISNFKPLGSTYWVPQARTLTINGTTLDLSANRSWTIGSGVSAGYGLSGTTTFIVDTTVIKSKVGFNTDYNNLSGRITTNTNNIATNTSNISANTTAITAREYALVPTGVKTSSYTLAVNDFVPTNSTSGTIALTLPTAPANGSILGAKMVVQGGTNTTTITAGGSDVFNVSGGVTSVILTGLNQSAIFKYSSGIWYVLDNSFALAFLDLRYSPIAGSSSINTLGTIGTGIWNGSIIGSGYGGTGVNNGSSTITLGGNLTTSGAFPLTLTQTASTNVTLPTSGTLVNSVTTGNGVSATNTAGALAFTLGAITPSTVNGNTFTTGTYTLTGTAGKTLTFNNSITLAGTDATTMTFPTTSATIARTDAGNTFTGHQTIEGVTSAGATGTNNLVFNNSPSLTTPLINATGTNFNFSLSGGSSAFGSTSAVNYQLNGSTNVLYRAGFYGNTSAVLAANNSYANIIMAGSAGATTTTSGTSAMLANLAIGAPAFSLGTGSTTTWAATVDIEGAATTSGSGTLTNPVLALLVRSGNSLFNGNLTFGSVGNGISIKEGTNAAMGQGTLSGGTLVVSNTRVTANSRIFLTDEGGGVVANIGALYISARTAGTSFTVSSSNSLDTSTFSWIIIEPAP